MRHMDPILKKMMEKKFKPWTPYLFTFKR